MGKVMPARSSTPPIEHLKPNGYIENKTASAIIASRYE